MWIKKSRKEEMTGLEIRALFVSAALTHFKWFCEYFNVKRTLCVVFHAPAFNGLVELFNSFPNIMLWKQTNFVSLQCITSFWI